MQMLLKLQKTKDKEEILKEDIWKINILTTEK